MMKQQHEYRFLFVDDHSQGEGQDAAAQETPDHAAIPGGLSYVSLPSASATDPASAPVRPSICTMENESQRQPVAQAAVLEVIESAAAACAGRADGILLRSASAELVRVNGRSAPLLAVLQLGDQVQVGEGAMMHLTAYRRPSLGRPDKDRIGKECIICRVPFEEKTRIYVCPSCDTALHCETDEHGPEGKRLECAVMGPRCPFCNEPISMSEGYDHVPDQ